MKEKLSPKEQSILEQVERNKELEPYFFNKLIENHDIKWLRPLHEKGFFDADQIPHVIEGYVQEWFVLGYIESIVSDIDEGEDSELILKILNKTAENTSDNFRVVSQSIRILSKINASTYGNEYLRSLFKYWFSCQNLMYVIHGFLDDLMPTVAKDREKAYCAFSAMMKTILSIKEENEQTYLIERIIKNAELVGDLVKSDYEGIIELCISLIEELLIKKESNYKLNNGIELKLSNEQNTYTLLINDRVVYTLEFIDRYANIAKLIEVLNSENIVEDEHELKRAATILYVNLFSENCFQSVFDKQNHMFSTKDYLPALLKNIIFKGIEQKRQTKSILTRLFLSNFDYLVKIAIYILCEAFSRYSVFFVELCKENNDILDYITRYYIYGDELKHLFEAFEEMDEEFKKVIDNCIEKGEFIKHEWENNRDMLWKQERYKALRKIEYFSVKYEQLKKITMRDPDLIPAMSFSGVHSVTSESPISEEEMFSMSNDELVEVIKNTKEDSKSFFVDVSLTGLGNALDKVIKGNPERFTNELYKFDRIQYQVAVSMINSFKDMLGKQAFDIENVIVFLKLYISQNGFWQDEYYYENKKDHPNALYHKPALKQFFWFLRDYLSNDNVIFSDNIYLDLIDMLNKCLGEHNFGEIEDVLFSNKDVAFYVLNSLDGVIAIVILELGLRLIREKRKYKEYWAKDIKPIFTNMMKGKSISTYFVLGEYIAQFIQFESDWAFKTTKAITPDDDMWQFFFSGYLTSSVLYSDLYNKFGENYIYALDFNFIDKSIKNRLAGHITFAYLNGFEKDSALKPFEQIISHWDTELICEVLSTCNRIKFSEIAKKTTKIEFNTKILRIWNEIKIHYKSLQELENSETMIIENASRLAMHLDVINSDVIENLRFSFSFLKESHRNYWITEYLGEMIKIEMKNDQLDKIIYDYFMACLPSFPKEKVQALLDYLKKQQKDDWLRDIVKEYMHLNSRSYFVEYIVKLESS